MSSDQIRRLELALLKDGIAGLESDLNELRSRLRAIEAAGQPVQSMTTTRQMLADDTYHFIEPVIRAQLLKDTD